MRLGRVSRCACVVGLVAVSVVLTGGTSGAGTSGQPNSNYRDGVAYYGPRPAGDLKKRAVFFGDSNLAMASGGLLGLQNTTTTDYSVNAEVGSGLEDWLLNIAYQPSPPDAAVIALGGNNVLSDGVWGSDDQDALHRAIELSSATMRCTVLVLPQPAMLKDGVPLLPEVNKALWAEAVFTNQRNAALTAANSTHRVYISNWLTLSDPSVHPDWWDSARIHMTATGYFFYVAHLAQSVRDHCGFPG